MNILFPSLGMKQPLTPYKSVLRLKRSSSKFFSSHLAVKKLKNSPEMNEINHIKTRDSWNNWWLVGISHCILSTYATSYQAFILTSYFLWNLKGLFILQNMQFHDCDLFLLVDTWHTKNLLICCPWRYQRYLSYWKLKSFQSYGYLKLILLI